MMKKFHIPDLAALIFVTIVSNLAFSVGIVPPDAVGYGANLKLLAYFAIAALFVSIIASAWIFGAWILLTGGLSNLGYGWYHAGPWEELGNLMICGSGITLLLGCVSLTDKQGWLGTNGERLLNDSTIHATIAQALALLASSIITSRSAKDFLEIHVDWSNLWGYQFMWLLTIMAGVYVMARMLVRITRTLLHRQISITESS